MDVLFLLNSAANFKTPTHTSKPHEFDSLESSIVLEFFVQDFRLFFSEFQVVKLSPRHRPIDKNEKQNDKDNYENIFQQFYWRCLHFFISNVPTVADLIFRVAILQKKPRLFVAFLVQIMQQCRIGVGRQLPRKFINAREQGHEIRFRIRRRHFFYGGVEFYQRG